MGLQNIYSIYRANPQICNDTRSIKQGCIYWAIRGERFDGNSFVEQAFEKGAAYAVIDNAAYKINDRCILVEDSLKTLQDLAAYHRRQLGIPVVAITGSNGKTTCKELIKRVLSTKLNTFATPGNLNNHIGLPLSLLQLTDAHQVAVIELGANHQRENAFLCEICLPDYGIITNIGKDHLEGFGGMAGVEKANMELFDYLKGHGGMAFVNADDEMIMRNVKGLKLYSYGTSASADVSGRIAEKFPLIKAAIKEKSSGEEIAVQSHLFGSFQLYNLLLASAVGRYFGVGFKDIKAALESYVPENNRSQIVKSGSNTLIMDAYNANPSSMQAALADFTDYPAHNKVLILGDMFELGEESEQEHRAILENIHWDKFAAVALAGQAFSDLKNGYKGNFFETTEALKSWFKAQHFENATIYMKGSRGMKLESILAE